MFKHGESSAQVPYIRDICTLSASNSVSATPLSRHILVFTNFFRALCLISGGILLVLFELVFERADLYRVNANCFSK